MTLRILQWNVWYKEDAKNILAFLRETDADILCLQELTQDSEANPGQDIVADICRLGYDKTYKLTIDRAKNKMGNGIFSKHPIVSSRTVYVQEEEPGSIDYTKENRIYIEANIRFNQDELTIGTTHLSYSHAFTTSPEKEAEATRLYDEVNQHSNAFVLTGDFNTTPNSPIIKRFESTLKNAGPELERPTWTTKPFAYNGFEADTLKWRLDYVFSTPDINVITSDVLQTTASDHLPILTTIEI